MLFIIYWDMVYAIKHKPECWLLLINHGRETNFLIKTLDKDIYVEREGERRVEKKFKSDSSSYKDAHCKTVVSMAASLERNRPNHVDGISSY